MRTDRSSVNESTKSSTNFQHLNNCSQKMDLISSKLYSSRTLGVMHFFKSKPNLNRGLLIDLQINLRKELKAHVISRIERNKKV